MRKHRSTVVGGICLVVALSVQPVKAVPGAILGVIDPPGNCDGFGVALWPPDLVAYTCPGVPAILLTDLGSNSVGSIGTYDAATHAPLVVDAIAWDAAEQVFWGGNTSAGQCRVWRIEPLIGAATLRFSFVDPHGGCSSAFFDGIAADAATGTLYLSPMRHPLIHPVHKNGAPAGTDIHFSPQASPMCGQPCENSGLAAGRNGVLFAGATGTGQIYTFDAPTGALTGLLASVGGEVEDLECGPIVGGNIETLLARDQFSDRITIVQAPPGSCSDRDLPPDTTLIDYPARWDPRTFAEFIFTGIDDRTPTAGLTYECTLDGVRTPCLSPTRYTGLAEGDHHFEVAAIDDPLHQIDPTPATYDWTVDRTPPVVTLSTNCAVPGALDWCRSPSFSFAGSATDTLSPVFDSACYADGSLTNFGNPCGGTVSGEGRHTVRVEGEDRARNTAAATKQVGIDSRTPTGSVRVPQALTIGTFGVTWQTGDLTSGLARITVEERGLGSGGYTPVCGQSLGGGIAQGSCARNPGFGYFCYRIVVGDVAGNTFTSTSWDPSDVNSARSGACTFHV